MTLETAATETRGRRWKPTPEEWTRILKTKYDNKAVKRERAAWLVAEDRLPDRLIAVEMGFHRDTLARWKRDPLFMARVQEIRAQLVANLGARGGVQSG